MEVKEASWGKWSPWSHCKPPVNCRGHGTRTRHRFCLQDPQKPMLICRVSKGVSDLEMRLDNFALQALNLAKTSVPIYISRKCTTPSRGQIFLRTQFLKMNFKSTFPALAQEIHKVLWVFYEKDLLKLVHMSAGKAN